MRSCERLMDVFFPVQQAQWAGVNEVIRTDSHWAAFDLIPLGTEPEPFGGAVRAAVEATVE